MENQYENVTTGVRFMDKLKRPRLWLGLHYAVQVTRFHFFPQVMQARIVTGKWRQDKSAQKMANVRSESVLSPMWM